jgi:predicted nucleic acid-binding protein
MKILADTSVWVEHLRHGDQQMREFLAAGDIAVHDHVVGELRLGGLSREKLAMMQLLRRCAAASHDEVMHLIEQRRLVGRGLGYVDTHLLAAALIGGLRLWTLDKALQQAARECGCGLAAH